MNNEKIIAWAVMKGDECLSVRRFEPVASGEANGVEFVPLVRMAEQPAQQQEPVAWATRMGEYAHIHWGAKRPEYPMVYEVPLYTSPPASKPWVGLTRDERMSIINRLIGQDWVYALDAIEAKLKEKNT